MAAIDKIYGTTEQYDEFKAWLMMEKPEALKYLYVRGDYKPGEQRVISTFPEKVDMWLLENCPIPFVIKAIKYQYNIERD